MISPFDTSIPVLPAVTLVALQLYVDRAGQIVPDTKGYIGCVLKGRAAVMSANNVWVMQDGADAHDVFQAFARYDASVVFANPNLIHNPYDVDIDDIALVVTGFKAGALGAKRAGDHARRNVTEDLEVWRRLAVMSDGALAFALETNVETVADLVKHESNCDELIAVANSNHPLAKEVRDFLQRMRNPRDIRNRHNVWRMVLMVRAVQRRAQELASGKHDTLAALQFRNRDLEAWVGAVVQRASRMAGELEDRQPWWFKVDTALPKGVNRKRVLNFISRLQVYKEELRRAYVEPFGFWAALAVEAMYNMILGFRNERYENIARDARKAVAALQAIVLREQVSLAIQMVQGHNGPRVLRQLQEAATAWRNTHDRYLGHRTGTTMSQVVFKLDNIDPNHPCIADALRDIEGEFDAVGS